jgi:hypothetical protein
VGDVDSGPLPTASGSAPPVYDETVDVPEGSVTVTLATVSVLSVLNEQTGSGNGTTAETLVVNGIHVFLTDALIDGMCSILPKRVRHREGGRTFASTVSVQ